MALTSTKPRMRAVAGISSGGMLLLAIFTFLLIGRAPEVFLFLLPFRPLLVTGVIVIAWATTVPVKRGSPFWAEPEARLTLGLLLYAVATIPFSIWRGETVEFVLGFAKIVTVVIVIVHCVRSLRQVTIIVWAVLGAALLLQFALISGYGGLDTQTGALLSGADERAWVTGTYDPNDLAFLMMCVLPLAFFRAVSARGISRWLAGVVAFLCIVVTIRTGSRSGFIAMVVVGAILLAQVRGPRRWIALGLAALALFGLASGAYWDRIGTIWGRTAPGIGEYDAGGFDTARWNTWVTFMGLAIDHLPLGSGAGTITTAEGETHWGGKWETAHNSLLQIAVEMGIPGLAIFVTLLYRALKSCRRLRHAALSRPELHDIRWVTQAVETSLYAYVAGALTLSQAYAAILYVLLALAVCLRRIARQQTAHA
jgi:O-antigen ligase